MSINIGDILSVSTSISKTGCIQIVGIQSDSGCLIKGWNWDYLGVSYDNEKKKAFGEPIKLKKVNICQ